MTPENEFKQFISQEGFPCMGARSAFRRNELYFFVAEDIQSPKNDKETIRFIYEFIQLTHSAFKTCIVIFKTPTTLTEREFEKALWQRLQCLHHLDCVNHSWAPNVCADVTDKNFSFSLGEQAFFIVGLHPNSSRKARQFAYPTLVFNLHEQFEQLRRENHYETMKSKIRENDKAFSGSVNPMLQDFGSESEALQYSGRWIKGEFKCPFRVKPSKHN